MKFKGKQLGVYKQRNKMVHSVVPETNVTSCSNYAQKKKNKITHSGGGVKKSLKEGVSPL